VTKRILAIHAHPDDVEFLAAGTLALLAKSGHAITIVTMTPGDLGSTEMTAEETAATRRREAANAARLIGAEYFCAEFRDLAIYTDDLSRRRVAEILRRAHPDIVLTSSPIDYLCDHEATSTLVRDALFGAPIPNYVTGDPNPAPRLHEIPHLYFMDPLGGVDREDRPVIADFYADVSESFETKRRMLMEHKSQREWLLRHHGVDDYILTMEKQTHEIGRRAGLDLAEGFRRYKGHPYPQSPLLEELLGARVHHPAA
jgi:LmbE family N-acetylglucosaminyl deacetylase